MITKQTNIIIIGFFLMFSLFFSGCFSSHTPDIETEKKGQELSVTPIKKSKNESVQKKDEKKDESLSYDFSGCETISCKENIIVSYAINESEVNACNDIESEDYRLNCKDEVYYSMGITMNDFSYCEKIINNFLREKCQEEESFQDMEATSSDIKSISDCDLIENLSVRDSCKKKFTVDYSYFSLDQCRDLLKSSDRLKCQEKVLLKFKNKQEILDCDLFESEDYKNRCLQQNISISDKIFLDRAIIQNNIEMCNAIKSDQQKNSCKNTIYYHNAMSLKKKLWCNDITDKEWKEQCFSDYTDQVDIPYLEKARNEKDSKNCIFIEDPSLQKECSQLFERENN